MHRYKSPFHIVGMTAAVAGVGILAPLGFKELILEALNKAFHLGLEVDRSAGSGWALLLVGVALLVYGEICFNRAGPKRPFIAFRHHSIKSHGSPLQPEQLGKKYVDLEILQVDCDQSMFLSREVCDPVGAVRGCLQKTSELAAAQKLHPDAPVGYYGLAHVALQFLAGSEVASQSMVLLFEQDRTNGLWTELKARGSDLDLTVVTVEQPPAIRSIVVRIAISYDIHREDIAAAVPHPFADIRVGLKTPRIDAVGAYNQVNDIATRFRRVLDQAHALRNNGIPIHVFYAGPACLGFSLGRQISKNIHHPVWVHQYDGTQTPRYRWAVQVTGNGQPETMVAVQPAK